MSKEGMLRAQLLSLNVKGLSNKLKRKSVFMWLKNKPADIIFLQETHGVKSQENNWKKEWGGEIIFSHGQSNARGVCILFKPGLAHKVLFSYEDKAGRLQILKCEINGKEYSLVNIYAPNTDKQAAEFYKGIKELLVRFNIANNMNILMGGDINCQLNPLLDKKGRMGKKGIVTAKHLCDQCDL